MMNLRKLNIWGPGQILAYSGIDGQTDFDNGIVMRTAFDGIGFDVRLPFEGGSIRFDTKALESGEVTLAGDFFHVGELKGVFVDTWHLLLEGEFQIEAGSTIETIQSGARTLLGAKSFFRPELLGSDLDALMAERRASLDAWPIPESASCEARKTLTKAYSQLRTMFYSPVGEIKHRWTTPDRWPHRNTWLWDSVFHAIGLRHLNADLAREALAGVFDIQREDGFIPLCGSPGYKTEMTQPPVLALGVKLVDEVAPSATFLAASYPHLKAYLEWDLANRDTDGAGLLEWFIEENENCRSGESGMDNSPRFDAAIQLDATDFNSFMSLECEIMAEFAQRLGFAADAAIWAERHENLNRLINERLWHAEKEFYCDYDVNLGQRSEMMASAGFLPLICGAASPRQAEQLAAHLDNPQTFKTPLPVASIAICDEASYSKDMWRGPVWVNMNWLIALGFRRYGMTEQAARIISQTVQIIEKMYLQYGTLFEFYDDRQMVDPPELLRKGCNQPDSYHQAFHDFGWTATLYIDMLFS
jgi:glycogen debranching enzyme